MVTSLFSLIGHNAKKIQSLNGELNKSFSMIYIGPVKQIFSMKITRDKKNKKLWLSQKRYVQKVLERFNLTKSKPVCFLFTSHFKLILKQFPLCDEEINEIKKGSLCIYN